jgi:aspartyl-tRNA(Asn)/glutamyl-tRNA(Gln) amidotransferase subunit A
MKLHELNIKQASDLLGKKEITSRELTQAVFDRIDLIEPQIEAFISLSKDRALSEADLADRRIADKTAGPLTGIPFSIKDLICTKGIPTTCASRILENFVPPYDATVMEKLRSAGAVIIGKTNMDEFAMGSTTEHSGFKTTRNPWDTRRIPGGSSGGSAASVSAGMCIASLGSDTGGSIRQPASHCSVVGLKPTYGRVSRFGIVAYASSLDQIGPITKTVEDAALVLNAIAGHDPRDSTSIPSQTPDYTRTLNDGLDGVTVGIPREYFETEGVDPSVLKAVEDAIETIKAQGAKIVDVSLPHSRYVVSAYYVIAPCEASSNLARYDGVKYGFRDRDAQEMIAMYRNTRSRGFGKEVQRRIIIGTYCLSAGYYDAYYRKASQIRTLVMEDFKKAFETCRVLLAPTAPTPPILIGETLEDPLTMYLSDIFTLSANLAGIPGISVPCGFSPEGLPIGLQLLGNHFGEPEILQVAHNFEKATDFHERRPCI